MLWARAPLRLDLAGGTIDIYPLYLFLDGGLTINGAIDRYASVRVEERPGQEISLSAADLGLEERFDSVEEIDLHGGLGLVKRLLKFYKPTPGLSLRTSVDAPPGAGLGGSSALALAVCAALEFISHRHSDLPRLIELVRDLEAQSLGVPAGVQDYYAAGYGGLSAIWLGPGEERREQLPLSNEFVKELERGLILGYTGVAHSSGRLNWEVFKRFVDGEPAVRTALAQVKEATLRMYEALRAEDLVEVGRALCAEWEARRRLALPIAPAQVERLIAKALESAALGAKLCGAGGGGALLALAREGARAEVETALQEEGVLLFPFAFAPRGLEVCASKPDRL
ncbi:MAG: hypothetical protein NUW06_05865 [Candidatus Acetothermia bacterium]|jgi:D-glycero-alpha-D-manno-heptose-7-phosphate kinase|nr:hypothetical protein [Candidatus Acetothermia bacterium]MDH7505811.1 hypothetical protein [Candidatus Acetothermia bacterium]